MATPIPTNQARFTIEEIASATRGTVLTMLPHYRIEVKGVVSDSRSVEPGSVFVALVGETHDGHAFLEVAARKGAAVAIVERGHRGHREKTFDGMVMIEVDDTLVAWGDLAQARLEKWREGRSERRVVAITGSAGKTTTKELVAALLASVGPTHFTAGNLNNRIGVPSVVFALEDKHRFAVLEMGMSLPGELDAITAFAPPDVSVVIVGRWEVMDRRAAVSADPELRFDAGNRRRSRHRTDLLPRVRRGSDGADCRRRRGDASREGCGAQADVDAGRVPHAALSLRR